MSKRRGFTLVELMVVVGILGLLLVALMPSFGQVRLIARNIRCQNNLHNIYVGMADARANATGSSVLMMPDASKFPAEVPGLRVDVSNYLCAEDVNATQLMPTPDPNFASVGSGTNSAKDNQTLTNDAKNDPTSPGAGLQYGSSMGGPAPRLFTAFAPGFHAVARRGMDNGRGYWEFAVEDSFARQATWTGAMNDGIWRVYDPLPGREDQLDFVCVYATCQWNNSVYLDGNEIFRGPHGTKSLRLDTVRKPGDPTKYDNLVAQWTQSGYAPFKFKFIPTNYGVNENLKNFTTMQDAIAVMDYDVLRGGKLIRVNNKAPAAVSYNALLSGAKRHNGSLNALLSGGSVRQFGPNEINPNLSGVNNIVIHRLWGRSSSCPN